MPAYPSRIRRPSNPAPLELTARDEAILASVYQHRFLASRHVHALHFAGVSLRAAQRRLRRLWEHAYLDRAIIPSVLIGTPEIGAVGTRAISHTGGPLYCLAEAGARVVERTTGTPYAQIPSTPQQNQVGFATLSHHLVGTDWLVALAAPAGSLRAEPIVRERELRRIANQDSGLLVPDAAAAIRAGEEAAWCYLEVVRADPRGGRRTIRRKLERYAALRHRRAFERGYGHRPLRRVLFALPTEARRDSLRALAATLPHGRQLFAFGCYGPGASMSAPSAFLPETIDAPLWVTADDPEPRRLSELLTDSPHAGAA